MSGVMWHVSCVRCIMLGVACHFFFFFLDKVVGLVDGWSVINGAYPVQFFYISNISKSQQSKVELLLMHAASRFTKLLNLVLKSNINLPIEISAFYSVLLAGSCQKSSKDLHILFLMQSFCANTKLVTSFTSW